MHPKTSIPVRAGLDYGGGTQGQQAHHGAHLEPSGTPVGEAQDVVIEPVFLVPHAFRTSLIHGASNPKEMVAIEEVATHCIECGFCEPACPSRNVTTTPWQRTVLRREMARQQEGSPVLAQLQNEFEYDGIETCAADGTCAIACPVSINTGALVKSFRRAESTEAREKVALQVAKRWATVEKLARTAMGAADIIQRTIGVKALTGLTASARLAICKDLVPSIPGPMPRSAPRRLPATTRKGATAVYFPACVNRIFGRNPDQPRHPSLP